MTSTWTPNGQATDVEIKQTDKLYDGHYQLNRYQLRHKTFEGSWGGWIIREQLLRRDATAVLLYDPVRDRVVLVEQFRVGPLHREDAPTPWLLEIPAGLNDHADPAQVGIKEVKEETGLIIQKKMIPIGQYYTTPGGFSEKIYLFCALIDSQKAGGIHGLADEGEEIKVVVLSFEEIWNLLANGLVTSSSTYIALQWLALNRTRLREDESCPTGSNLHPT